MTIKELRVARATAIEAARAVLDAAENRSLSTEEEAQFTAFHTEANRIKAHIDNIELQEAEERSLNESRGRRTQDTHTTDSADTLRSWLLGEGARSLM